MSTCCPSNAAAGRFFSLFARRFSKRYAKKGLDGPQTRMLETLIQLGIKGCQILEIGCGVGYLHQNLLQRGAGSATGIELSERMIDEARAAAAARGLADRAQYHLGDFVALADDIEDTDITILDKVICCYPDAKALVTRSINKTRLAYAIIIPRKRWYVLMGYSILNSLLWLVRSLFRGYVHDPEKIEHWVTDQGFVKHSQSQNIIWLTQVYTKA